MNYYGYPCNNDGFGFTPCGNCPMHQIVPNIILPYPYEDVFRMDKGGKKAVIEEQVLLPTTFKIAYPIVKGLGNEKVEKKINGEIADKVGELFRTQVLLPEVIAFNEINGFYEITLNEKGILSILFGLYTYVEHAAHGFTKYSSLTINLENGKVYKFEGLFNSKVYYEGAINQLANKYIKENDVPLLTEYKGVTPDQEFYLTPDELVIYYQVYEYTPYAYGLFKIPISYTDIRNLLGPLSPIQKLL